MATNSSRSSLRNVKERLVHKLLNRFFLFFLIMLILTLGFINADQKQIISIPAVIIEVLKAMVTIFVSYALATLFTKLTVNAILDYFVRMDHTEERILMGKIYLALIYLLATLVVFWQFDITVQNIAIFLGLITTGFAFALRDVILSYFIWFILLTKKPFKIGDYIRIDDGGSIEGLVKHIGLFYVVIDPTPESYEDYFKVPNKLFLEKPIKNYGRGKFRNEFAVYFDKSKLPIDLPQKTELLKEKVWDSLDVNVNFFLGADSDGVKITVYYMSTYERREQIRHQITSMILDELVKTQNNQ